MAEGAHPVAVQDECVVGNRDLALAVPLLQEGDFIDRLGHVPIGRSSPPNRRDIAERTAIRTPSRRDDARARVFRPIQEMIGGEREGGPFRHSFTDRADDNGTRIPVDHAPDRAAQFASIVATHKLLDRLLAFSEHDAVKLGKCLKQTPRPTGRAGTAENDPRVRAKRLQAFRGCNYDWQHIHEARDHQE